MAFPGDNAGNISTPIFAAVQIELRLIEDALSLSESVPPASP
jgi:hypothetical protein